MHLMDVHPANIVDEVSQLRSEVEARIGELHPSFDSFSLEEQRIYLLQALGEGLIIDAKEINKFLTTLDPKIELMKILSSYIKK